MTFKGTFKMTFKRIFKWMFERFSKIYEKQFKNVYLVPKSQEGECQLGVAGLWEVLGWSYAVWRAGKPSLWEAFWSLQLLS